MDKLARLCGRQYTLFRYDGHPEAERVVISMGSGAEVVRETALALAAKGEKVGALQVAALPPVLGRAFPRRAAGNREIDRGARPLQGARRRRRAALPGRGHGAGDRLRRRRTHHAARDRRALRPVVQGIPPRHGQGGVRRTGQQGAEERLHHRHRRRRVAYQPRLRPRLRHPVARHHARRVLRARRRRHGGRQQEQREDPRRGARPLCPGLFRLRFAQVGRRDDLASALRHEADQQPPISSAMPISSPATSSTS